MKITYIYHSGFAVENENCIFVFDYYKNEMPENVVTATRNGSKDVYFFVSHSHQDHFNPEIFNYDTDNVYYLISKDLRDKIAHRGWLEGHDAIQLEYVEAYQCMILQGKNGSHIYIETLKSTDKGVAFLVTSDNKTIYHAGDLNNWLFEGMDKAKYGDMKARYTREIERINNRTIDVAFLPVDPRLDQYYMEGPAYFVENTKTSFVFPMHMWEKYEYIDKFRNEPRIKAIQTKIMDVDMEKKSWDI